MPSDAIREVEAMTRNEALSPEVRREAAEELERLRAAERPMEELASARAIRGTFSSPEEAARRRQAAAHQAIADDAAIWQPREPQPYSEPWLSGGVFTKEDVQGNRRRLTEAEEQRAYRVEGNPSLSGLAASAAENPGDVPHLDALLGAAQGPRTRKWVEPAPVEAYDYYTNTPEGRAEVEADPNLLRDDVREGSPGWRHYVDRAWIAASHMAQQRGESLERVGYAKRADPNAVELKDSPNPISTVDRLRAEVGALSTAGDMAITGGLLGRSRAALMGVLMPEQEARAKEDAGIAAMMPGSTREVADPATLAPHSARGVADATIPGAGLRNRELRQMQNTVSQWPAYGVAALHPLTAANKAATLSGQGLSWTAQALAKPRVRSALTSLATQIAPAAKLAPYARYVKEVGRELVEGVSAGAADQMLRELSDGTGRIEDAVQNVALASAAGGALGSLPSIFGARSRLNMAVEMDPAGARVRASGGVPLGPFTTSSATLTNARARMADQFGDASKELPEAFLAGELTPLAYDAAALIKQHRISTAADIAKRRVVHPERTQAVPVDTIWLQHGDKKVQLRDYIADVLKNEAAPLGATGQPLKDFRKAYYYRKEMPLSDVGLRRLDGVRFMRPDDPRILDYEETPNWAPKVHDQFDDLGEMLRDPLEKDPEMLAAVDAVRRSASRAALELDSLGSLPFQDVGATTLPAGSSQAAIEALRKDVARLALLRGDPDGWKNIVVPNDVLVEGFRKGVPGAPSQEGGLASRASVVPEGFTDDSGVLSGVAQQVKGPMLKFRPREKTDGYRATETGTLFNYRSGVGSDALTARRDGRVDVMEEDAFSLDPQAVAKDGVVIALLPRRVKGGEAKEMAELEGMPPHMRASMKRWYNETFPGMRALDLEESDNIARSKRDLATLWRGADTAHMDRFLHHAETGEDPALIAQLQKGLMDWTPDTGIGFKAQQDASMARLLVLSARLKAGDNPAAADAAERETRDKLLAIAEARASREIRADVGKTMASILASVATSDTLYRAAVGNWRAVVGLPDARMIDRAANLFPGQRPTQEVESQQPAASAQPPLLSPPGATP